MRPLEIGLLYGIVGVAVAVAHGLGRGWRILVLAGLFWPFYLPGVLARSPRPAPTEGPDRVHTAVQALEQALAGWDALPARPDLISLRARLQRLSTRLEHLDRVLADLARALPPEDQLRPLRERRDRMRGELEQALAAVAGLAARTWVVRFSGDGGDAVARDLVALGDLVRAGSEAEVDPTRRDA